MPRDFFHGRHAGLLVPLFSLPSRESWGIGEIGDLPRMGAWMADAGFSFLQLLPINEMADGQNSPYSAMSAMAIDPIFISPAAVPDVGALGGEALLPKAARARLKKARASTSIDYSAVRTVKLPRAPRRLRALPRARMEGRHQPRAPPQGLHRSRQLVARGLRALPHPPRQVRRALVARVGRAAARIATPPRCRKCART